LTPVLLVLAAEVARLIGQDVEVRSDGYTIRDIAGEGAPLVGVVERRGDSLWLIGPPAGALRLTGPLAHPRIAGPGYKVWVIGERDGDAVRARRIGILAPPAR
jgi:hypothetical protein